MSMKVLGVVPLWSRVRFHTAAMCALGLLATCTSEPALDEELDKPPREQVDGLPHEQLDEPVQEHADEPAQEEQTDGLPQEQLDRVPQEQLDRVPQEQLDDIVTEAPRAKAIFVGEVVAIAQRLSQPDKDGRAIPFRFVTWRVDRAIRGAAEGATWTGRFIGGPFGDGRTLWVSEVPEIEIGQRALLLADDGDAGACALIGCRRGMLTMSDSTGTRLAPAAMEDAIAALDGEDATATQARSVDPDRPFVFAVPAATSPEESPVTEPAPLDAPASDSIPEPMTAAERAELDAFTANGENPVLP